LFQGSNACYSNPGVIREQVESFGSGGPRVVQYAAFGCVIPPYDFILYTPLFRDRLHLNAIFRVKSFPDVGGQLIAPIEAAISAMATELGVRVAERAESHELRACAVGASAGA